MQQESPQSAQELETQPQQLALVPVSPPPSTAAQILADMSAMDRDRDTQRKAEAARARAEAKAAKAAGKAGSQADAKAGASAKAGGAKAGPQAGAKAGTAAKARGGKAGSQAAAVGAAGAKAKASAAPPQAGFGPPMPAARPRSTEARGKAGAKAKASAAAPQASPKAGADQEMALVPHAPQQEPQRGNKRAKTGVRSGVEDEKSRMQFRVRAPGAASKSFKYTAENKAEVLEVAQTYLNAFIEELEH